MNTVKLQVEKYFKPLRDLSPNVKLELIEKLSKSIRKNKGHVSDFSVDKESEQEKNNKLYELFGSWKSEKTADEIIDEIKLSRTFNRERVEL